MPTTTTLTAEQRTPAHIARERWESIIHWALWSAAVLSILVTIGIVVVLLFEALQFFRTVSVPEFLTGTKWSPRNQEFGILPLFTGTLLVTAGAAIVALPLGLATAIYLSEYASPVVREILKPILEVLAGIPSVVYGFIAVVTVTPILRTLFDDVDVFNAASAAIVVGFMVLPMVVTLSEDVLRSVPRSLREAAYALGATKFDVTVRVVVPAALSGIMASFLLAISRAIGETMAVTLAAGQTPTLTLNPFRSIQTMTAYIVQVRNGECPTGSLDYSTIFAVGLALFATTMVLNIIAQWILSRMREQYE